MAYIFKREKRKNSLIVFSFLGLLIAVLFVFNSTGEFYFDRSAADINTSRSKETAIEKIVLLFVGDVMLDRGVESKSKKANDWKYPFLHSAEFLRKADLVFANLEGPISDKGTKVGSIYSFRANPNMVEGLKYSGIDIVSLANNHIWDYGGEAVEDTMNLLKDVGISYVGAGKNYNDAHNPAIIQIKSIKVSFLAYTNLISSSLDTVDSKPAVAFLDLGQVKRDIKLAKSLSDIVIVSIHWGEEYEKFHNEFQETVGKEIIDEGVSLVVGHHPHVIQEVEKYRDGYIAYSLGNFVFDQNISEETMKGIILSVVIKNKKIDSVHPIYFRINEEFQPVVYGN